MTINQRSTEHSEKSRFKEPVSVDNLADNLMEDLFHDIDRVLDGGSRLSTKSNRPEIVSLGQIKVPQIVVPEKKTEVQETSKEEQAKLVKAEAAKKENQSLDKLLLGAAFASILVTLSLWLATRGGLEKILSYLGYIQKPSETAKTLSPKVAADVQFADYIERSLNLIEEKNATQKQQQIPGIPPAPSSNNLPTVPVPSNPSPNASLILPLNRLVDLMEAQVAKEPITVPDTKVVVMPQLSPVVPYAVAAATTSDESSPKPSAASASNASTDAAKKVEEKSEAKETQAKPETTAKQTQEVATKPEARPETKPETKAQAEPETKPEPKPEGTVEAESQTEAKTETTAPTEPITLPPPPPTEMPSVETATNEVQSPINTLVGILELGERSAALFEIDGVARRIYVGESIGASGWNLVKVSNQEAVIRRNGEVRSVFVGQQF
ncbi:MAG: hypothetical protein QNJ68_10690 [Microcoleaceae cyanobacterium MO_207.B10]|nr:hypothetical protein [Microcoleaceae cyanobacterium MO_207.B10]